MVKKTEIMKLLNTSLFMQYVVYVAQINVIRYPKEAHGNVLIDYIFNVLIVVKKY